MYSLGRKDDAMAVCYDIVKDRMPCSKDEFVAIPHVDALAITYNGETVGCAFIHEGMYFHLTVKEEHQGKWSYNLWPDLVDYIYTNYGEVYSPVAKTNKKAMALMVRAGFIYVKEDSTYIWWCLSNVDTK